MGASSKLAKDKSAVERRRNSHHGALTLPARTQRQQEVETARTRLGEVTQRWQILRGPEDIALVGNEPQCAPTPNDSAEAAASLAVNPLAVSSDQRQHKQARKGRAKVFV
mmetsp:Transcript_2415/g.3893  ORF Transcript_2415/g.3893 Transcript_2415/m.3893 type:complete len:110 (-) Transcript_2415:263-592(-)